MVLAAVSRLAPGPVSATGTLATFDAFLVMILSAALGAPLVQRTTRDGRINLHLIMGACDSFLLPGLLFSQACRLLALHVPHAFAIGGTPAGASAMEHKTTYFS